MTIPESPTRRFPWGWILAVIAAYLIFVIVTFPVARLTPFLQRQGVALAGASGTIWNGKAGVVQMRGYTLGSAAWTVNPWQLFLGKVNATVEAKRDDGYLNGDVNVGLGGKIELRNVRGSLPLSILSGLQLPGGGVNGWSGTLQIDIDRLDLVKRWPTKLEGNVNVANLVGPPRQPSPLGGYRVVFAEGSTGSELRGAVTAEADSPLDLVGEIRLGVDRTYSLDVQVGTRRGAPSSIVKAIEYLGLPDGDGRRPLSMAGSL